jgi:hypothetical protein
MKPGRKAVRSGFPAGIVEKQKVGMRARSWAISRLSIRLLPSALKIRLA